MSARKAATAECLKWIEKMVPGGQAVKDMEAVLNALSDEQFDAYIDALDKDEEILSIAIPNLGTDKLEMERLLALGPELDHEFFEQLWLTDSKTGVTYLTPEKYLILLLPLRRQQQMLSKKISIPDNNNHVDELTGQVTGASKGASLSGPEIQILRSQGLDRPILEAIKVRGGDEKAYRQITREIIETGGANIDSALAAGTRVKGTQTLSDLLLGMHLKNNL
ncbi:RNA polymerase beta subunit [Xanthomonas phage RTH11]|nr:RNA polymerase beta subunit [Xanthomonas phage RTH11]